MNDKQWQMLLRIIAGQEVKPLPVGFIIDSPWLPGWAGISTLDYFNNDRLWFEANKRANETFPEVMFLPGFWAEYGMCTEPSAFGAKWSWHENELPYAEKIIRRTSDIDGVDVPDPAKQGLGPLVLERLKRWRKEIEAMGHSIRFAISRGPLNIASFLMGTTEFLMALKTEPERVHKLLRLITDFTVKWLRLQKDSFDTIDGVLVLDDIVGFCGPADFEEFARPYLKEIFACLDVSVRFFHNDANGKVCAGHLAGMGINMFNFSFEHSLKEMRQWAGEEIVLVGNIPPRDVLAQGTPEQVAEKVDEQMREMEDKRRILFSCGGGMTQGTSTENIRAFVRAVHEVDSPLGTS